MAVGEDMVRCGSVSDGSQWMLGMGKAVPKKSKQKVAAHVGSVECCHMLKRADSCEAITGAAMLIAGEGSGKSGRVGILQVQTSRRANAADVNASLSYYELAMGLRT